jgi:hypothetical protein
MDLQAIGKPILCHEGCLFGKGTRGHTTFNVDYVTYTQAHSIVLQQSILVSPYVSMHVQMLRSSNLKKSEDWIAREHRNNFGTLLCLQIMDQDAGVQLVGMNPDDIEILQILASGPSTTIHRYTSYGINGYTFYTRAQDNKKTNQNSGVRTDTCDCDGNKETYYGFIEEIWELGYRENLKVPLFHCQWIRHPNGVKTDKYGMTNVNLRFLGYREQPFVLANDVTQIFYVKDPDPANRDEHHIVLQGKRKIIRVEDVVDEKEYNQFDSLPLFSEDIAIPTIDGTEEPTCIHCDHDKAIIIR